MEDLQGRFGRAQKALREAKFIVIGAGAGLSDAAGLRYSGPAFEAAFAEFIARYGFEDLYTSSFYAFATEEERWAYWAKHINFCRYAPPAARLYRELLACVQGKEYFVITTNVDGQFHKAGFAPDRVWMVQGDYGERQCAAACHQGLYDNEKLVGEMLAQMEDGRVPPALVPRCPVCGGPMNVHLHSDGYFIEGESWQRAARQYSTFLERARTSAVVYWELGVGFNTPGIIRFPFEQLTRSNPRATLLRLNRDYPRGAGENTARTIAFDEEMAGVVGDLLQRKEKREDAS